MRALTIELPVQENQTAFNLLRWSELIGNTQLARELGRIEGRVETDRYGHIIMSPPPGLPHGAYQAEIAFKIRTMLPHGHTIVECPISTADGVRAADGVWISRERLARNGDNIVLTEAPEICAEVLSPDNTPREMAEKRALYFAAGAQEVWMCDLEGAMAFFARDLQTRIAASRLCPQFPAQVTLS